MIPNGQGDHFSSKLKIGDLRDVGTHLKFLGLFTLISVMEPITNVVHSNRKHLLTVFLDDLATSLMSNYCWPLLYICCFILMT